MQRTTLALLGFFTVAWPTAACQTPAQTPLPAAAATSDANTLGTSDVFEVRVYQEPDLSGAYRVSSEGTIVFPLLGTISVVGKTASETAGVLADALKKGFIKNPQVTVLVKEYNSKKVFVLGQVARPGAYAFSDDLSIVGAIAQAGGFTRSASPNGTHVTRLLNQKETRIEVHVDDIGKGREHNFALVPGDIVFVPESIF